MAGWAGWQTNRQTHCCREDADGNDQSAAAACLQKGYRLDHEEMNDVDVYSILSACGLRAPPCICHMYGENMVMTMNGRNMRSFLAACNYLLPASATACCCLPAFCLAAAKKRILAGVLVGG